MPTVNVPAPVHPTDENSITRVLADGLKRQERNVNDPNMWIYVGSGAPAPDFENGFANVGAPLCLLRYRFLRPYDPSTTQNAVQIQGSVTGGGDDLAIFTVLFPEWKPDGTPSGGGGLWPAATFDSDIHLTCHDDDGNLVMVTVQASTGKVFKGFV